MEQRNKEEKLVTISRAEDIKEANRTQAEKQESKEFCELMRDVEDSFWIRSFIIPLKNSSSEKNNGEVDLEKLSELDPKIWSVNDWYQYQYIRHLKSLLNEDCQITDMIKFNSSGLIEFRNNIRKKVNSPYLEEYSTVKRNKKNTISSFLRGIIGKDVLHDDDVINLLYGNEVEIKLSVRDIVFWDWLLTLNEKTIGRNLKKGDYDKINDYEELELDVIHNNICRVLARGTTRFTVTEFENSWQEKFPNRDNKLLWVEIEQELKELNAIIHGQKLEGEEYSLFLQKVSTLLRNCIEIINYKIIPDPYDPANVDKKADEK